MGQIDMPLTEIGKKDAEYLGENLKSANIEKVYLSDLERAYKTASIISEILNIDSEPEKFEELREIDSGKCCGMEAQCFSRKYPESQNDADFCFPKGESYKQFYKRIIDFIEGLEKKHNNKIILIVAHAGVIEAIEYYFGSFDFCNRDKIKIFH